jgi:hypothetical protein
MKGRRENKSFLEVGTSGRGHKERGNEGAYDDYVLYSYMKIEERNLLKLF